MGWGSRGYSVCLFYHILSFVPLFFFSFLSYVEGGRVEENVPGLSRLFLDRVPSTLLPQMMKSVLGASNCQKGAFVQEMGKMKSLLCLFIVSCFSLFLAKLTNTRMRVG